MPIILNNGTNLSEFNYEQIKADQFLNVNSKEFFNNEVESHDSKKCLYIGQREYATVRFDDSSIDIIGSDSATTCHILLIVDDETNNSSLCHFDGSDTIGGLSDMVKSLNELKQQENKQQRETHSKYSLYVVGGFNDDKKSSFELTQKLFKILSKFKEEFYLKLAIVTDLNNTKKNGIDFPIIYGLGYNIKTKKAFMCNKFSDRGPDMSVRGARHFSPNNNLCIYDPKQERLVIGPFHFDSYDYVEYCLKLPDKVLLKHFSTSPHQEPPDFIYNLKESFKMMLTYSNPYESYFKSKSNVYIKESNGQWVSV